MNQYSNGSVWRKWDLHVHSPESVLNNGFGSDWDIYIQSLFKILIAKEIAVVAITDYFTINGYKKVKEYLSNEEKLKELFSLEEIEKIKQILVLPNIEFRSDIFVGSSSVNFHVLFSEEVSIKDIEEKFLHEIDFIYQGEPQSEDKKRKLKEGNLIELGAQLKREHAEFKESELFTGMMNAVVDDKQVIKILSDKESIFGGKYVFVVMADEDLSSISWNSRDHLTRKVLIQKSDLLFSSNNNTRKWGLGLPPYKDGVEKFIAEFKTLKPCIHGSDAHEFKNIGHPCALRGISTHTCSNDSDCELRYCWIKADCTFEGLKQVLYEPADRVLIQENDPTPLKSSQSIAEFVIEGAALEPELKFAATDLYLNEGLIAITGGKGSGKTALVDLIADCYENRADCDDKNSFVKRISETENPKDLNIEIQLQNRTKFKKEVKESSFIEGASIVYVAQGELEKHVEDPQHLETYIKTLIFESKEIRDSELLFDYEYINNEVSDLNQRLQEINKTIFSLEVETDQKIEDDLNKECKKLETDFKDVERKIVELAKGLSSEKIKEAEEKQNQLTNLRIRKSQLTELGTLVKDAQKFLDENLHLFNALVEKINTLSKKLTFSEKFVTIDYPDSENLATFGAQALAELKKTIGEIEKFQKDLEEKEKGVKEHTRYLDGKKEIENGIRLIEDKLKIVQDKKKRLQEEISKRKTVYEQLLNKRIEQRNKYRGIINVFAANKNDILNDLEFTVELVFDQERFIQTMGELVDLRKINIKGLTELDSDIAFFTTAMSDLVADPSSENVSSLVNTHIPDLLEKIIPNQKRAEIISRQTIYNSIFADYLSVMPSVRYKKVKLLKLSLGQKATVLIKIYLAQGQNPIVIDSHDDHLDNEFIMEELVKALRQAKQHRQVIIVSNNGNVVVNSDAEQVIIASRDDQGTISYISGSLENPGLRSRLLQVLEGGEQAFEKRQKKYRLG